MAEKTDLQQGDPIYINRNLVNPDIEPNADDRYFTGDELKELRGVLVGGILATGILLVLFSTSLGNACIQHGSSWNLEYSTQMAMNFRTVGALLFIAGLVERVLLSVSKMRE